MHSLFAFGAFFRKIPAGRNSLKKGRFDLTPDPFVLSGKRPLMIFGILLKEEA
ncbi:MAG: hypothetical protein ACYCT9_13395 [Leptospirillum sp.]